LAATSTSTAKQSSRQQPLHVASPVGDEIDNYLPFNDAINWPIRLENDLPILSITKRSEFIGR
jgi:hypothetical protein